MNKFFLKSIFSIGENWLNKKNHTEHKYSVFLESQNKKMIELANLLKKRQSFPHNSNESVFRYLTDFFALLFRLP